MFYYIIPPIVIIISFSVLIYFLFRKIADVPQELMENNVNSVDVSQKSKIFASVGHVFLKILERLMHRAKLISLKFHNTSNQWFHLIRKKREKHLAMQAELQSQQQQNISYKSDNVKVDEVEASVQAPQRRKLEDFQMISKKVTLPRLKVEKEKIKQQLEEDLIKRIAVNPKDIEAYERLGDYYFDLQNLPDAMECYKQVVRLSPANNKTKVKIRKIERMLI